MGGDGKQMSVCDIDLGLELRKAHEEGYEKGRRDATQWISVKERVPRTDEQVLLITGQGAYRVGRFSYIGRERAVWFRCGKSVIPCRYWMPLPELPTMDGDAK